MNNENKAVAQLAWLCFIFIGALSLDALGDRNFSDEARVRASKSTQLLQKRQEELAAMGESRRDEIASLQKILAKTKSGEDLGKNPASLPKNLP